MQSILPEFRTLDRAHLQDALRSVDDETLHRFSLDIVGDDQDGLLTRVYLLKQRQDLLQGGDPVVREKDVG